ncbi:hypothetical protein ABTH22_19830, partial [Acinetobacter baumannii]
GNRSFSPTLTVVVDRTPPAVTMIKPAPNQAFGTATVTASASIFDTSPLTVTINGATTTLNSEHVASAQLTFANSGQQQVTVTATDLAGNVS